MEAHRGKVYTGYEELIGAEGDVRVPDRSRRPGVRQRRPLARRAGRGLEGEAIPTGARVRVEEVEGLTLRVRPVD